MPLDPEHSDSEKLELPEVSEEFVDEPSADEELSLDQLSRAYAEVLQNRKDSDADLEEGEEEEDEDYEEEEDEDYEEEEDEDYEEEEEEDYEEEEEEQSAKETQNNPLSFGEAQASFISSEIDPADEDEEDNAGCSIEPDTILEAILFVGCPPDTKLNAKKIAGIMRDVSPKEIKAITKKLNDHYQSTNAPYRIVSDSGDLKMQLVDDDEMNLVRAQFYGEVRHAKLNQNAIDVLAVVAYNQPVSKEEINKIRTRSSGPVLNQMVRRQLLTFEMTESKPHRKIYSTTDRFLDLFGLETLVDLPQTNAASDLEELAD